MVVNGQANIAVGRRDELWVARVGGHSNRLWRNKMQYSS